MKIAITSDIYYPMINGVAVFAHNLAHGLAKRGHEVLVICPSFKGDAYREIDDITGVVTEHLSSIRFPFYPDQINKVPENRELLGYSWPRLMYKHGIWTAPYPYPELKRILNEFQPDVIHNQTAETIALAVMWYARKTGTPLVSTGHAYPDNVTGQFKLLKPIKRPLDAVLRTYMASFLKHSEYATMPTELAIEDLVPSDNKRWTVPVEAISNGVDLSQFVAGAPSEEIYEKYKISRTRSIILYVGRIDPEKSIEKTIEAFAQVYRELDAELVIVGDGIARAGLEKEVERKGLNGKVKFLGKILGKELVEIYKTADLFATASETETQGIVLIEAAAMKLPLLAVDAGAVREICQDGRNGVLCAPGRVDELAEGMVKILSDSKLMEKMGAESLKIAKEHDLAKTLTRFEEVYGLAIERAKEKLLEDTI